MSPVASTAAALPASEQHLQINEFADRTQWAPPRMSDPRDLCLRCSHRSCEVTFVVDEDVWLPVSNDREEVLQSTWRHDLGPHARCPLADRLSVGLWPASAALVPHLDRAHPCIKRMQAGRDDEPVAF